MKKPKIDIHWKEFFIAKGEKIGLLVVGLICALLLVVGLKAFAARGKPEEHAKEFSDALTKKKKEMEDTPIDPSIVEVSSKLVPRSKKVDPIDPAGFTLHHYPIEPRPGDDGKRRNPRIFFPEEWATAVAFLQVNSIIFDSETKRERVWVVEGGPDVKKEGKVEFDPKAFQKTTRKSGTFQGMPTTADGRVAGQQKQDDEKNVGKLKLIDVADLEKNTKARVAERILPLHIAIIAGSFPMRKQYEEYVHSLQYADLNKLIKDTASVPAFEEIQVERRTIGTDGTEESKFASIDVKDQVMDLLVHTRKQVEADDSKLSALTFRGLVMPRPMLMDQTKKGYPKHEYPRVESRLALVQRTLEEQKRKGVKEPPTIFPKMVNDPSGIDPFNPTGVVTKPIEPVKPPEGSGSLTPEESAALQLEAIPEHYLFRFIDTELEPGKTYEYRMKLKVKNPNFGRTGDVDTAGHTEEPFIYSGDGDAGSWIVIPSKVYVPHEFQFFVVDEKPAGSGAAVLTPSKEQIVLQIHRWIDSIFPDPRNTRDESKLTIGDWVIAERELYYRGETIKRTRTHEVPVYSTLTDSFSLVKNPANKEEKVLVTMGPEDKKSEAVLVDFEGGDVRFKKDDAIGGGEFKATVPIEALVLGPDGKLLARNNEADKANKEREDRVKDARTKVEKIKKGKGSGSSSIFGSGS